MKRFGVWILLIFLTALCGCAPEAMAQCQTAYAALREADSLCYGTSDGQTVMTAEQDWLVVSQSGRQRWICLFADGQYLSGFYNDRLAWKSHMPQENKAPG